MVQLITWQAKIAIIAFIVALIAGLLLVIKWQHDMLEKQETIAASMITQKELADGIKRAQSQYATKKDVERYAKQLDINLKPIKEDLKKFDASIEGLSSVKIITAGRKDENKKSDNIAPRERMEGEPSMSSEEDSFGYLSNTQILKLNEPFENQSVPWGEASFSAWREAPWDLEVYKREYAVTNVLGVDEDGKHYVYSKFNVESNGETYEVDVTETSYVEEYPRSKFRVSPALYFGVDGGAYVTRTDYALVPNINLGLFSYGRTKLNPRWTFLGLGAGFETNLTEFTFVVSPVNYNIAKHIPLINNTYIGPNVAINLDGDVAIMLGLRLGL